jgi:PDZ domain-containing protein
MRSVWKRNAPAARDYPGWVRHLTPVRVAVAGLVLVVLAAALILLPSDSYILLPDRARAVEPLVNVQGERPDTDGGGIYFVAVDVRKASLLEKAFPGIHEGSTLVPGSQLLPPGVSEKARRQGELRAMARSQQVAAAVALRRLGYPVRTTNVGVLVDALVPDSPARGKLRPNDVIVGVDGEPVRSRADLLRLVGRHKPGEEMRVEVERGKKRETVTVTAGEDPRKPGRAVIGVFIDQAASIKLPLDVQIDIGNVGGPSAGLAFALDVMEELGTDVDGGRRIAATGEIELDGTVAPVGGVKQKTIAVRRSGIDVFLVPAGENAEEARRHAGDLQIVPVKNFQQALQSLETLDRA